MKCMSCNKETHFLTKEKRQSKFCGFDCYMIYRTQNKKLKEIRQPNNCIKCSEPLVSMKKTSKTCAACKRTTLTPIQKQCVVCQSDFIDKSRSKNKEVCSNKCDYKRGSFKELSTTQGKLKDRLRSRIRNCVKSERKSGSAIRDLGCTIEELKLYLESKFQPGMTWDNWSRCGWHIDHVVPLASFDLTDPEQFKQACHYTNLQPLWAKDNLSKSDRIL